MRVLHRVVSGLQPFRRRVLGYHARMAATYELPDLSYDYSALEPHYEARTLELHHDKHHATYVEGANTAAEKLAAAREDESFDHIVELEQALAFNVSGHVLHSLFWLNLSPDGGDKPSGTLATAIDQQFGSFDSVRTQLSTTITTLQGSGWAALVWDPIARCPQVTQIRDHHHNQIQGAVPLLVIDGWEHAFYLQYGPSKADYVDAIWNVVNWADVEARYSRASDLVLP